MSKQRRGRGRRSDEEMRNLEAEFRKWYLMGGKRQTKSSAVKLFGVSPVTLLKWWRTAESDLTAETRVTAPACPSQNTSYVGGPFGGIFR